MKLSTIPEMYERWLVGPLFRPWAAALLDRVELAAGDRVLDVACGTGIVARLAKERLGDAGSVVGVDLSPQMIATARTVAPTIDWREGSATALPVAGAETFDVVLCQQGLQFFPDRPAAAREMRRVLAPGGRLGLSTWRPLDEVPFFRDLHQLAERHLGPVVDQRHAFGSAADVEGLLAGAGCRDIRVETMTLTMRFDDPVPLLHMNAMALAGMSPASRAMDDEARAQVVAAIANESAGLLPRYADRDGVAFELSANVATARA